MHATVQNYQDRNNKAKSIFHIPTYNTNPDRRVTKKCTLPKARDIVRKYSETHFLFLSNMQHIVRKYMRNKAGNICSSLAYQEVHETESHGLFFTEDHMLVVQQI